MTAPQRIHIDIDLGDVIGLIGDLHGDADALYKIIDENPDVAQWIQLGDALDMKSPRHINDPVARITRANPKLLAIRGNHETALLASHLTGLSSAQREEVESWPLFMTVTFGPYLVETAHEQAHIRDEAIADILAYAHTHQFVMQETAGKWHLNPGLSVAGGKWIRIETDPLKIEAVSI